MRCCKNTQNWPQPNWRFRNYFSQEAEDLEELSRKEESDNDSILGRRKIKCKAWRLENMTLVLRHEETIETFSPRFMLQMRMDWRKARLQQQNCKHVNKSLKVLVRTAEVLSRGFYVRSDWSLKGANERKLRAKLLKIHKNQGTTVVGKAG